jgi:hypothetical protein
MDFSCDQVSLYTEGPRLQEQVLTPRECGSQGRVQGKKGQVQLRRDQPGGCGG